MRIFTLLTRRDPTALATLIQQLLPLQPTGLTLITKFDLVAAPPLPQDQTPEHHLQLADQAATRKDYIAAARHQQDANTASLTLWEHNLTGAQWIKDQITPTPLKDITQLIVLGNGHWSPASDPFTPTNFFLKVNAISTALTTPPGIGGTVQQTPLLQRTYVPFPELVPGGVVPTGNSAAGEPPPAASTSVHSTPGRHPSLPAKLSDMQARYAGFRLGLDRGGSRRSKQEAGNQMGLSPTLAGRMENEVAKLWPEFEATVNS